jgi:2-dehydropantoate 2-reductase
LAVERRLRHSGREAALKIGVMGSGGVGGFFGMRLAQAGLDVTFIARGAHLAAMREHGLKIENPQLGDALLTDVKATDDPSTVGVVDVVLFAVKLWDTETAARLIAPMVGPENGVLKDDTLRRVFPAKAVMGGVGYVATAIARPGVIGQTGALQRAVIGEYDGTPSERARALVEAFQRTGVAAELSADIRRALWEKYVFLVGLSSMTSLTRLPIGPVRANPKTRDFLYQIMSEAVAVGRAHGVALPADYADDRMAFVDGLAETMTSSMHHDLDHGNRLEVDWLSGGVVTLGAEVGVPTPVNSAACALLAPHAAGRPGGAP